MKLRPPAERFWEKVDKAGKCWLWTASLRKDGYGQFNMGNAHMVGAHRVAYELCIGPIPAGLDVLHSCDTPRCVKPEHLHLGTAQSNAAEARDRDRLVLPNLRGEQLPFAKLNDAAVRDIRKRYGARGACRALAREYGVDPTQIKKAALGKTWRHVV